MYALSSIPAVDYQPPWMQALQDRLRTLARGRQRVAYFYEVPDNSTFRYRVYNMAQVLNDGDGDVSAAYFFLDDLHRLDEIAGLADLLVICRTRYDHRVHHLIAAFRNGDNLDEAFMHSMGQNTAQVQQAWYTSLGYKGASAQQGPQAQQSGAHAGGGILSGIGALISQLFGSFKLSK